MELEELRAETGEKVFEGEGGAYYVWSSSDMACSNVAAAWLQLQPAGFALPHYADSHKLGYVLQGTDGLVGMVLPNTTKEIVLSLKKGDVIPVPKGAMSWWFNPNHSQQPITIVFLGQTSSHSLVPGQFTYFFLTGALSFLGGYSTELIKKLYNFTTDQATKLTKSQTELLIIKLPEGHPKFPDPHIDFTRELVFNLDASHGSGSVQSLTESEFGFMGEVGLSVVRVRLEGGEIRAPIQSVNCGVEVIYVARGSGRVEVVGMKGKNVLNSEVKVGQLIVVPSFFGVAYIAGDEGMETFSMLTTKRPAFVKLAGKGSIWEAISPAVQEVALNVDSEFEKLFLTNLSKT